MTKLVVNFPEYEKGKMHWLSWVEQNPEKVKEIRERFRKRWLKKQAHDAGFDPNEPRNQRGEWSNTGTKSDWKINDLEEEDVDEDTEEDVRETIHNDFPNQKHYDVVGPPTSSYNCLAWAFGFNDRWWNPCRYDIEVLDDRLGRVYHATIHTRVDEDFYATFHAPIKPGQVRLAAFEDDGKFTHMARQLPDGRWTSKFGGNGKTVQKDLGEMEGGTYGSVERFYEMSIKEFSKFRKDHQRKTNSDTWL